MAPYTVHLRPPQYPAKCFPSRCRHEPQFVMQAAVKLGGPRRKMEIDHCVCFACGLPREATYGGNVFVDLQALWRELGWHVEIGARILFLRAKWARIATYLFDENGWNGRHERVARLIDPNLTMRLRLEDTGHGVRLGHVSFDASYVREDADA